MTPGQSKTKGSKVRSGKLPFVFLNLAMTADGKITTANRQVIGFGSARDQAHMMELRATADAVMSGARTVDAGPVTLGPGPAKYRRLRLRNGLAEYNLRVIVTGSGSIDPKARIFQKRFSPILVLTTERAGRARLKRLESLADGVFIGGKSKIDFRKAFLWLRANWGVQRLLCEGGGELDDALFRQDLVDELHLTICPLIFGGRDAPTICEGVGAKSLADATRLKLKSLKRFRDELFLVYARASARSRPVRPPSIAAEKRASTF